MDEAYLDYVRGEDGAPIASGLINHPELLPVIDADAASAANLEGGEENVATGYHAIEFLLWGQDVSPTGPGARPFGDFLEGPLATAAHGERRRALLGVLGGLLVRDLTSVRDAWTEGQPHNFRAAFLALPPRDAMRLVLLGMASLAGTELAGERLNVPYLTQEAEDEHSCFSDTTQSDQLHDAMGLRNVYLGRYQRLDGSVVSGARTLRARGCPRCGARCASPCPARRRGRGAGGRPLALRSGDLGGRRRARAGGGQASAARTPGADRDPRGDRGPAGNPPELDRVR
jgi:putative iron-regulated protein